MPEGCLVSGLKRSTYLFGYICVIVSQENEVWKVSKILILSVLNCSLPVGDKTDNCVS